MPNKKTPKTLTLSDRVDDHALQNQVINHVTVFGFRDVISNIIEAYREQAKRFNTEADKLERVYKKNA